MTTGNSGEMTTTNPGHGGKKGFAQLPAVRSKSTLGMRTQNNMWGTRSASLRNATLRPREHTTLPSSRFIATASVEWFLFGGMGVARILILLLST